MPSKASFSIKTMKMTSSILMNSCFSLKFLSEHSLRTTQKEQRNSFMKEVVVSQTTQDTSYLCCLVTVTNSFVTYSIATLSWDSFDIEYLMTTELATKEDDHFTNFIGEIKDYTQFSWM